MLIHTTAIQNGHFEEYDVLRNWLLTETKNGNLFALCARVYEEEKDQFRLDDLKDGFPEYAAMDSVEDDFPDYSILKEFAQEFRGKASHTAGQIREDMNAALSDASSKAHAVGSFVKENVSAYTPVKFPTSSNDTEQANGVKINLESLDLNKDGVVDEKDFLLLNQNKK